MGYLRRPHWDGRWSRLAVAIPSLVAYNMFARWTRLMRQDIEGFVVDIHAYAVHNASQLATVEVK